MSKRKLFYFLSITLALALLLPGNTRASTITAPTGGQPAPQATAPSSAEPLPDDCDGVAPPGACCAFGYTYFQDAPTAGVTVTVESPSGSTVITTTSGPASSDPYYRVDLSSAPLAVEPGDTITVTAHYRDMASSRAWPVQANGQQIDLGLLPNPQGLALPAESIDWIERTPMPVASVAFAYATLEGKIYLIGGDTDGPGSASTLFQRYDPLTDDWETDTDHGGTLAPLPAARAVMVAGVIHGKIHAVGGWDENYGYQDEHYVYDPATNTWSTAASLPTFPIGQFGVAWQDKLYIFGGWSGSYRTEVYEYAEPGGWTTKTSMPTARNHGTVAVSGNTLYVIAGEGAGDLPTGVIEAYHPLSDTWTTGLAPLPVPQFWLGSSGAPALAGEIYLVGPLGSRSAYSYNPAADSWHTWNSLPQTAGVGVAEISGSLYIIGGQNTYQGITAPWPASGRENGHSGRSPYLGPQAASAAWSFQAGPAVYSSPAIGPDQTVYFGSDNGKLYALGQEGDLRWAYQAGGAIRTGVALGNDGALYFGSLDHALYALSAEGGLLWTFPTGNEIDATPIVAPDGSVYFVSVDGQFYALHADGTLRCSFPVGAASGAPALGPDGVIYVSGGNTRRLYALNPDCSLKWEGDPAANVLRSGAALSPDGKTVYYGSDDGYLYAREAATGALKWQSPASYGGVWSAPAIGSDGTIYATTMMGALWALDPADGSLLWAYPTNLEIHNSPVIDADGVIYFGTGYGYVFAVNPDGSQRWTYQSGSGHFFTSPALGRDGRLYLGASNGEFFALGAPAEACGTRLAPWAASAGLPLPAGTHFPGKQAVIFDGHLYAFGERTSGGTIITDTYVSDILPQGSLSPWRATTPLPGEYFDHVTVRIGRFVYLITGADGSLAVFYAPLQPGGGVGSWASTTPLDPSRQDFAAAAYGEYLYVAAGNASAPTNKVWFTSAHPDGSLGNWAETTSLPETAEGHTLAVYRKHLYALLPNQAVYYASIQVDGTLGAWQATTPLPHPTSGHATFILGNKLYLLEANSADAYETVIQADGSLGAWMASPSLPAARSRLYAGGQGCFAYALGGYDGSQYVTTAFASRLVTPPQASFAAVPLSGPAPLSVAFRDQSGGDVTSWQWDFGDGQISGARYPEMVYTDPGDYAVTLVASGPGGADELRRAAYIHVGEVAPPTPPLATLDYLWYASQPDPAVQGQDVILLGGSGVDTDEGGMSIRGYNWRSSLDGVLSDQPNFTLPAADLSVGEHTIYFSVWDDEGYQSSEVTRTLRVAAPPTGSVQTLIVVNRQQFELLYGSAAADQVLAALGQLAGDPNVAGQIVQVGDDAGVAAAYAAWNAEPGNNQKANAASAAIKSVLDARWAAQPSLRYVVIVGDDRAIPFHRVADHTGYPESLYTGLVLTTTVGAALHENLILSDDFYADAIPTSWNGHDLYLPDLGIGRLVETPAEIVGQVNVFLASNGLNAGLAGVSGYGAVRDSATAICHELGNDGLATNCSLIGGSWGRSQFIANLLDARHDLVSINGHASHFTFDTPADEVYSSDILAGSADLTQALFYSMGCHAGLNVPPATAQALDFPQAFASRRAAFVGNTGFGWSQRASIGLSEQLMLDFTERLVYGQSATLGRALAAAKREYYLNEGDFDSFDEKILIETTLYGLPMTRFETPDSALKRMTARPPSAQVKAQAVTRPDGLTVNHIDYQFPPLVPVSSAEGVYYTFGGQTHSGDGEPIQPKYLADLSFPQTHLHGVMLRGGTYSDLPSFDPVIEQVITATATLSEPLFSAAGWYPALFYRFNELGLTDRLVTVLGQFQPETATERLYERLSFDLYYHDSSGDWQAPAITSVVSDVTGSLATLTVKANDASGVAGVVVAYTDNQGTWASVELVENAGQWSGEIPAGANTEFFVQAVDNAGNVAVVDNGGVYFHVAGTPLVLYLPVLRK